MRPHRARACPRGRPAQAGPDRGNHCPRHGARTRDQARTRAGVRTRPDPGRAAAAQAHPGTDHRPGTAARHHQGRRAGPGTHQGGLRGRLRRLRRPARLSRCQAGRCADRRPRGQRPAGPGQQDRLAVRPRGRRLHPRQQAAWCPLHRHPAPPDHRHPGPGPGPPRGACRLRSRPQPADAAGLRRLAGRPPPQRSGPAGRPTAAALRDPDPARGRPEERIAARRQHARDAALHPGTVRGPDGSRVRGG